MKVFIAGLGSHEQIAKKHKPLFVLESFYYFKDWENSLIENSDDFMLDSGAFTFMGGFKYSDKSNGIEFGEYIERYADFINRNKVNKFFELDVDVCVGYEKVKEYRKTLEKLTNRKPIPVWHSNRGKEDFLRSCDEYPYVALGGIVGGSWGTKAEKAIPWFIAEAHKRNTKIHGLGFTKTSKLNKCHFDSVDSATWISAASLGNLCFFTGTQMRQYYSTTKGYRTKDRDAICEFNLKEWIKFQKYAENHY